MTRANTFSTRVKHGDFNLQVAGMKPAHTNCQRIDRTSWTPRVKVNPLAGSETEFR